MIRDSDTTSVEHVTTTYTASGLEWNKTAAELGITAETKDHQLRQIAMYEQVTALGQGQDARGMYNCLVQMRDDLREQMREILRGTPATW